MYSFLVIDDEPMICKSICLMLERSGLPIGEIKGAGDGKEALAYMKAKAFDFIITDIRMPKMDGLQLLREIVKSWPDTHILVVSGYDEFKYAQQALKYGAKDYLLKPLNQKALVKTITEIIKKYKISDHQFHISHNEIEVMVATFEVALGEESQLSTEREFEKVLKLLSEESVDISSVIMKDILDALMDRLSKRIGCKLNFELKSFSGSNKKELSLWFRKILDDILKSISMWKFDANFNIISEAKRYIEEHYNKDLSLDDLGTKFNFNPCYFSQFFKHKTGKSFVEYRTEVRMCKAKELLYKPDKTVTEVAFDVGYQSSTHFIRVFRKYAGMPPTEFRDKRRNIK